MASASAPLLGLGDDGELGPRLGQARLQLRAQHRLVFGDQGGQREDIYAVLRCLSGASLACGIAIVAWAPCGRIA